MIQTTYQKYMLINISMHSQLQPCTYMQLVIAEKLHHLHRNGRTRESIWEYNSIPGFNEH